MGACGERLITEGRQRRTMKQDFPRLSALLCLLGKARGAIMCLLGIRRRVRKARCDKSTAAWLSVAGDAIVVTLAPVTQ